MKFFIKIFNIFYFFSLIFIFANMQNVYCTYKDYDTQHDINHSILSEKNLNCCKIKTIDDRLNNTSIININYSQISHKNINDAIYNNYKFSESLSRRDRSKLKIQFQNDSITLLRMLHEDLKNMIYHDNNTVFFMQMGIQNLLSNKIITFGGGKRYAPNNKCIIGYNTILHIPYDYPVIQPYSMNIGLEYWYDNLIFKINSYYNLNKILYPKKSSYTNFFQYPEIGYQICAQMKLPYLAEYTAQIKWEKFFHKNSTENCFQQLDKDKPNLSLGIGYQLISILNINVNSIFTYNRYINTLLAITLNYQFNIPIMQQIQKHNHNIKKASTTNNFSSILEVFTPIISNTVNYNNIQLLESISEISGFPGEIKIIRINNNSTLHMKSFKKNGGKILPLKNNIHLVRLPKYTDYTKNKASPLSHDNQVSLHNIENETTSESKNNQKISSDNNLQTDTIRDNINFTAPPPPKLPIFTEKSLPSSSSEKQESSKTVTKFNAEDKALFNKHQDSSCFLSNSNDLKDQFNSNITTNINKNDLSYLLSVHKKTKFPSIGTKEYIENLEKTITERKKDKHMSDMEKIFNKLHITESMSSIEESLDTEDSSDF